MQPTTARTRIRKSRTFTGRLKKMIINLWRNEKMNQWRWSLTETGLMTQHTGTQEELRDAMNDVANTVEYIIDNELKEE